MKAGYTIKNQEKAHFITATVADWIDIFTRKNYRGNIIECLDYCLKKQGHDSIWFCDYEQSHSYDYSIQ
jgi:hypothetical protein